MNLISAQLNKPVTMTQTMPQPTKTTAEPVKSDENSKDKKDLFTKNKAVLGAFGAIALGGIAYFAVTRGKKPVSVAPKTHIERLNAFGDEIIEDLKLSPKGKLVEKIITAGDIKHTAKYNDGILMSVDEYIPLRSDVLADEKYATLRAIMDETKTELAILQDLGESKNYYLLDKTGEKMTGVNEFDADPDVMYQYLSMRLSPDKTKVYEVSDSYSPKGNAAIAEIFENFKI